MDFREMLMPRYWLFKICRGRGFVEVFVHDIAACVCEQQPLVQVSPKMRPRQGLAKGRIEEENLYIALKLDYIIISRMRDAYNCKNPFDVTYRYLIFA